MRSLRDPAHQGCKNRSTDDGHDDERTANFGVPARAPLCQAQRWWGSKPVVVLIRGDDQLNEAKLAGLLDSGC